MEDEVPRKVAATPIVQPSSFCGVFLQTANLRLNKLIRVLILISIKIYANRALQIVLSIKSAQNGSTYRQNNAYGEEGELVNY